MPIRAPLVVGDTEPVSVLLLKESKDCVQAARCQDRIRDRFALARSLAKRLSLSSIKPSVPGHGEFMLRSCTCMPLELWFVYM